MARYVAQTPDAAAPGAEPSRPVHGPVRRRVGADITLSPDRVAEAPVVVKRLGLEVVVVERERLYGEVQSEHA